MSALRTHQLIVLLSAAATTFGLEHVGRWNSAIHGVPTSKLPSGPIMGNGDLGVTVSGDGNSLAFWLALNQFWAIEEYEYPHPGEPPFPRPLPVAQVIVNAPQALASKLSQFSAEQDVDKAEVRTLAGTSDNTTWITTRSYVAVNNNTLVTELAWFTSSSSQSKDALVFNITTQTYPGVNGAPTAAGCTAPLGKGSTKCDVNGAPWGQWVKRHAFPTYGPYPVEAAVATRLIGGMSTNTSTDTTVWSSASMALPVNSTVYLVSTALTNRDDIVFFQDPLTIVQQLLGQMENTEALQEEHQAWWKKYWDTPRVVLPGNELTEMYWYGNQYALACASREGKVPPGLWGPWVTSDGSAWHGDYTLNYNFMATWYGAYSSNRMEQAINQYKPLMDFRPLGRQGANAFNCTGLHFPVHIAPWGFASSLGPSPFGDLKQHSTASFSALNFISHWEYSQDRDFLHQYAFPFVSEVAEFWECWLKKETASDGSYRWVDPDDCANEQCSGNPSNVNPIVSITFIRRIFKALVDMAIVLGEEVKPVWHDIAENISMPVTVLVDIPTTEMALLTANKSTNLSMKATKGAVWLFSEVLGGKTAPPPRPGANPLNLYPIWPSEQVTLASSAEELTIARNSLLYMHSWSEGNAFMEAFPAAVRAGLEPTTLMQIWNTSLQNQMQPNLIVFQGGGGTETIGGIQAVNDMLLQSCDPFIRLFPVWPKDQDASFSELRAKGAFLVSANYSHLSHSVQGKIAIKSEAGLNCSVLNPWPTTQASHVTVSDVSGGTVITHWSENVLTFPTQVGHTYNIMLNTRAFSAQIPSTP